MKTIVLANEKGGVGKSAVATLLVQFLVKQGQRVLAVDFDHQGNFSSAIGLSKRATSVGTADQILSKTGFTVPSHPCVLVPASRSLLLLEPDKAMHTPFARNFRAFLRSTDTQFDVCVVDTNPSPDIRLVSALASTDFVLSPIQLNQWALDGVKALLTDPRVGVQKIKALLNPKLQFIGLLPTLVEPTPYQKANFAALVERHRSLMIPLSDRPGDFAFIPKRSAIPEADGDGVPLWELKKTAARDAWREIEPTFAKLAAVITTQPTGGSDGAAV